MKSVKLALLKTGGVITSLTPLITAIIINWNDYVMASGGDSMKLTIGGTIAVLLIAISCLGKLQIPSRRMFFAILFVIIFLLEPILADLKLLVGCALGGEVLNSLTFEIFAKKYQEKITMEKQANINAVETKKIVEEVIAKTNGRV